MHLLVLEVTFILTGLCGVAAWSPPTALVLGGVLGVLACERAAAKRKQDQADKPKKGAGQ